jgi:prepilin-type N-terminal cleavage/methylation domain-containing protein
MFILYKRGFTLIELLIVMAILGILAVVVFVAINPTEKQAQARDAGRVTAVASMGRSLQAYYTQQASYPPEATWASDLLSHGELSSFPSGIGYTAYSVTNCTGFVQPAVDPTYCYNLDTDNGALVYSRAESTSYNTKCTSPEVAYFVFSSSDSRGGTICSASEPTAWASGTQTYVP